jgi:hypothetical protein
VWAEVGYSPDPYPCPGACCVELQGTRTGLRAMTFVSCKDACGGRGGSTQMEATSPSPRPLDRSHGGPQRGSVHAKQPVATTAPCTADWSLSLHSARSLNQTNFLISPLAKESSRAAKSFWRFSGGECSSSSSQDGRASEVRMRTAQPFHVLACKTETRCPLP